MSEWQPIKTAPRDGTLVLMFGPCGMDVGRWVNSLNDKKDAGWTAYKVKSWGYEEYGHELPSHWMPLPEPPVAV